MAKKYVEIDEESANRIWSKVVNWADHVDDFQNITENLIALKAVLQLGGIGNMEHFDMESREIAYDFSNRYAEIKENGNDPWDE